MTSTRFTVLVVALVVGSVGCSSVRRVQISSDPQGAEIYVDEKKVGEAPLEHDFDFADPKRRYKVVAEKEGFVPNHITVNRLFLQSQGNEFTVDIEEDQVYRNTVDSEAANAWVQLETNPRFDSDRVWKILVDTVTEYYPVLTQRDSESGYIASEDKSRTFRRGLENAKLRSQFLSAIASEKPLIYKVKIAVEILERGKWEPFSRILQEDAELIEELEKRLAAVQ